MKQLYFLQVFLLGMFTMTAAGTKPVWGLSAGEVLLPETSMQRNDIGQHTLTIHISPLPSAGSVTVTPDQSHFDPGDIITIAAIPAAKGWRFRNWTNQDDEEVSRDSLYIFSMPGHDLELTANFVDINIMKIHDVFALPGDTILVEVELINRMDTVIAFTHSTFLEEGFTYIAGSAKLNPERQNGHQIIPAIPNGELRLIGFDSNNNHFNGDEGVLFRYKLLTPETEGFYNMEFKLIGEGRTIIINRDSEILSFNAINGTAFLKGYYIYYSVVDDYGGILSAALLEDNGHIVLSGDQLVINQQVEFTATPNIGYQVKEWRRNGKLVKVNGLPYTDTIYIPLWDNPDYTELDTLNVTVEFELTEYMLDISIEPENTAVVLKDPDQDMYNYGDFVGLEVLANPGYTFSHWSGDSAHLNNPFIPKPELEIPPSNVHLTVHMDAIDYILDLCVSPEESGSIEANPSQEFYNVYNEIDLEAFPATGWEFVEWTGDIDNLTSPGSTKTLLTMPPGNVSLTATFQLIDYTLSLDVDPEEGGMVEGDGVYNFQDVVYIQAIPATGWFFSGWSGDIQHIDEPGQASNTFSMPAGDVILTANFQMIDYTLSLEAEPEEGGLLEGEGVYNYQDMVSIQAIAATGWTFFQWSGDIQHLDDPGQTSTTFSMPAGDISLTATFQMIDYTLSLEADPEEGGIVLGEGLYNYQNMVPIQAISAAGWAFVQWTGDIQHLDDPAQAAAECTMPAENVSLTAIFQEDPNITITYQATTGGTVTPTSEILPPATGEAIGSTAIPDPGYSFANWTNDVGDLVGTEPHFIPQTDDDGLNFEATYTANFQEDPDVTITYEATIGGSVDPESESLPPATGVAAGSTANPLPGYHFVNWTNDDGEEMGTELHFVPQTDDDGLNFEATYTANFQEDPDVTINYLATSGGTVTPTHETLPPATGEAQGSTATPLPGYHFVNWTNDDGEEMGTELHFVPQTDDDGLNFEATYTANFQENPDVTITYEATIGGSVDPENESLPPATGVAAGSTATPHPGYHFVNWTNDDGEEVGTELHFVPQADDDGLNFEATYTANFEEADDVTITYEATIGGSVDPENESLPPATGVAAGSTATPHPGHHFVNWTNDDGEEVGAELHFVPQTDDDGLNFEATYTANFQEDPDVTINYLATIGGTVTPTSETLPPATGEAQGSTATPLPGYHFVNWTNDDGEAVGTELHFVPQTDDDGLNFEATYTANFEEDDNVTIIYEATIGGSVDPDSESLPPATGVAAGSTATPHPGYHFVNWTNDDGEEVGAELHFVPQTDDDGLNFEATYTANFQEDPDVTINYLATIGGTVTPTSETLPPATGEAQGSTATPLPGYHFVNWTNEAGEVLETDLHFVPQTDDDGLNFEATYTANFQEDPDVIITYEASIGGSVDPDSESLPPATGVAAGSTATPHPGYHFVNWTNEAGEVVETELHFVPQTDDDGLNFEATYTANFQEDPDVTINYLATIGGTVTPTHEILPPATGEAQGSTATPLPGYHFVNWSNDDGEEVGTELHFVPQTNDDGLNFEATYTANFQEDPDVIITYEASIGGSVDPDSESLPPATGEAQGSNATANPGYHFVNWTNEAGEVVETDLHFVPQTDDDGLNFEATYTANFQEDPDVTITYEATTGGNVNPEIEVLPPATGIAQGSTATPYPGYHFVNWTNEAGEVVETDPHFVPHTDDDGLNFEATYTANFQLTDYTLSIETSPYNQAGEVDIDPHQTHYNIYDVVYLEAMPAQWYIFIRWEGDTDALDDPDSAMTVLTFPDRDIALTAVFQRVTYNIDLIADPVSGGTVDGAAIYPHGSEVNIAAAENPGYIFVHWKENDSIITQNRNYTFIAEENRTLTAFFRHTGNIDALFIPNAFMPASQYPENREFKPVFRETPESYALSVYNRWGERVFQTDNPEKGWDGLFNNVEAPQGTYTYKIRYKMVTGSEQEVYGILFLTR